MLIIEDLHWADRSTRDLIGFLVRAARPGRLLLVCTYRTDELQRGHPLRPFLAELDRARGVERVELGRLDRDGTAAILADLLGAEPPPGPSTTSTTAPRATPSSSRSWPSPVTRSAARRSPRRCATCCWPGWTGYPSRPSGCCGSPPPAAPASPTTCSPRSPGCPRPSWRTRYAPPSRPSWWWPTRTVTTSSGTRWSARPYTTSCCPASTPGCTPASPPPSRPSRIWSPPAAAPAEIAHHWYAAHDHPRALVAARAAACAAADRYAYAEQRRLLERALELWELVPDAADLLGMDHLALLEQTLAAAVTAGDFSRALTLTRAGLAEVDADAAPLRAARLLDQRGRLMALLGKSDGSRELR